MIVKVAGHGGFRKRIVEMGFIKGKMVEVLQNAPLQDPVKYKILGYEVSLRRSEAELIEVETDADKAGEKLTVHTSTVSDTDRVKMLRHSSNTINIVLIGNPNCGKTSLFNMASGGHEHVGNYSGVTVDAKEGFMDMTVKVRRNEKGEMEIFHDNLGQCADNCASCGIGSTCSQKDAEGFEDKTYHFRLVDLPGTYSLSAYSPEELYVRRHLIDDTPDIVINVVDSSNLERNLYLTTQLIDMHQRMVIALNMYDELQHSGDKLDYKQLGSLLGVPMVPTI